MSHNNNAEFNLMELLVRQEDETTTVLLSPSVSAIPSFGWQDFPLLQPEVQQNDDDKATMNENSHVAALLLLDDDDKNDAQDPTCAASPCIKIAPSPALAFDSFAWSDFPVVVTNTKAFSSSDETVTTTYSSDSSLRSWSEDMTMDDEEALEKTMTRHWEASSRIISF